MNTSIKLPNKTAPPVSSFVNIPNMPPAIANLPKSVNTMAQNAMATVNTAANSMFKTANTAATNVANSVGNLFADSVAPINESIQGSFESTTSPFLTIPMVILIGVLVIALIIFIKFKDQIALASELVLRKIHLWWSGMSGASGASMSAVPAMPASIDGGAVDRMLPPSKEVFHVGDNKYVYSEAAPLCEAMGAELATYDDVKKALEKGADWCSYGWVKGQQAVYPTQESTFQKLQQGPEDQRNACGTRPGVQGGYFDNPELRFGVTCVGKKPSASDRDQRAAAKGAVLTPDALKYQKEVNRFKQQSNEIPVAPFHANTWNA